MNETTPRDRHARSTRVLIRNGGNNNRRHVAALLSRLLPLVVLVVGAMCWLWSLPTASGQFANPNLRGGAPTGSAVGAQGTLNPAPSIPATAIPQAGENAAVPQTIGEGQTEESTASAWQMPAFVRRIAQGGWLMIPLGVCSLIVITLSLERLIALCRGRVIPRPFVRRFTECVEDGQLSYDEATELCEEFQCPVAEVFRAAVRRWGRPMFEVEQAVMDAGDRVGDGLKRFLRVFHAISNVAPLLGLLGTVLGMIEAFEMISDQSAAGGHETIASGISVALMTTAGGLSVAIPAYLAFMYFSAKSDSYLNEIDRLCQRVVDCISAEGLEEAGSNQRSNRKRRAA